MNRYNLMTCERNVRLEALCAKPWPSTLFLVPPPKYLAALMSRYKWMTCEQACIAIHFVGIKIDENLETHASFETAFESLVPELSLKP